MTHKTEGLETSSILTRRANCQQRVVPLNFLPKGNRVGVPDPLQDAWRNPGVDTTNHSYATRHLLIQKETPASVPISTAVTFRGLWGNFMGTSASKPSIQSSTSLKLLIFFSSLPILLSFWLGLLDFLAKMPNTFHWIL